MAVLQQEDFNNVGNVGTTISAAQTIFSGVGGSPQVVAGLEGAKAANIDNGTSTGSMTNSGFTGATKQVFRFLFRFANLPAAETPIANCYEGTIATGTKIADIVLQVDGRLRVRNQNTAIGTTTTALAVNTTYAVEWSVDVGANTQEMRLFTNLTQTASPAETPITGSANAPVALIELFRMAKVNAVTWTGGITFDSYKRMDDWWATPVVAGTSWDIKFAGTAGNSVTTGGGIQSFTGSAPVYAAGGPHTDQSVAMYVDQASQNRNIRATTFTASEDQTYESFYCMLADYPNGDPGQSPLRIWKAQSGTLVTSFSIVAQAQAPANQHTIELWEQENWQLPESETNGPLGRIINVPLDQYFRIDIDLRNNTGTGDRTINVMVFAGQAKNLTGAANATGTMTGTTTLGGLRNRFLCQETISEPQAKPQVSFDSWRAGTVGPIGPIPANEQYDPPVGVTWTAWELQNNGTELPLTPAGELLPAGTISAIDLPATTVKSDTGPPSTLRFSGDPGVGKIYLGYDSEGGFTSGGQQNWHMTELDRLRAVSLPAPYDQRTVDTYGVYRAFYVMPVNDPNGTGLFGNHSDNSWTEMRQAAANYDIVNATYDLEPNTAGNLTQRITQFLAGYYDPWMDSFAAGIIDVYNRYGTVIHCNVGNEPDAVGNSNWNDNATNVAYFRQCSRYLHFSLLARGVPRDAFEVTSGTLTNPTAYQHATRFNANGGQTSGAWVGGNAGDGIHQWHPDWKGTITGWANAFAPNPADFYRAGDVDPWGYGTGPTTRFWSINSYCQGPFGSIGTYMDWTNATYRTHLVSAQSGHAGNWQRFFRALYGGNGLPMGILEFGYGIKMLGLPSTTADLNVDIQESCDQQQRHIDDWVAENISYVAKWRQTYVGHAGDVAFGYKRNGNNTGTTAVVDNQDGYRKMWASGWHHPAVVGAFRSGTYAPSQTKPLNPQHG